MYPSVQAAFVPLSKRLEGYTSWMYLDQLGKVTTGMGDLIDSPGAAQGLPWKHGQGGSLASPDEVAIAWNALKARQDLAPLGGGNVAFQNLSDLRLDDSAISDLVNGKLFQFEAQLRSQYPSYDSWPADAQMALLFMAWAMGPAIAAKFPKFSAALNQVTPDFRAAGAESHMTGVGIDERNAEIRQMWENAAQVVEQGADFQTLFFPGGVSVSALAQTNPANQPQTQSQQGSIAKALSSTSGKVILGVVVLGAIGGTLWYLDKKGKIDLPEVKIPELPDFFGTSGAGKPA
jgi:hypothetical protein